MAFADRFSKYDKNQEIAIYVLHMCGFEKSRIFQIRDREVTWSSS